ncbi:MAG TPA: alpha/beta fold hydrolase [Xanthobacteraceae bacterium]|jgi:pimeloyl-ACP methyl ester carboxylesterase|nr:alpha/beta fold hydrolase [Xanthobacteraceae bacterium]
MRKILRVLWGVLVFFAVGLVAALVLVATPEPPIPAPKDLFGFASAGKLPPDLPPLKRYAARDGEELAYRLYDSPSNRVLIFIHGSSYHGGGYHLLASAISAAGVAKVVLPNMRGHYQSGRRRGDVDYIGQYEDDLEDLIRYLRVQGLTGPITLGGHSSGGGFAIRFAGGAHAAEVSSYLLLSPIIPLSNTMRGGDAGGWSILHWKRLYGLIALNAVGIHGFNGLPVIAFNKPPEFWDGTETLSYSYRLNASYLPRPRYRNDIKALTPRTLVLIGTKDEAIDADALRELMADAAPQAQMKILPDINHFGIFTERVPLDIITTWMRSLPESQ